MKTEPNVTQAVPFFRVRDMEASLRWYVDGVGFRRTNQWVVDDKIRWCWLQIGNAALMLQEYVDNGHGSKVPDGKLGLGVSVCFQCRDALAIYRDVKSRSVDASVPSVGNNMWVTTLTDPDGYWIEFESETDVPEGTEYSGG